MVEFESLSTEAGAKVRYQRRISGFDALQLWIVFEGVVNSKVEQVVLRFRRPVHFFDVKVANNSRSDSVVILRFLFWRLYAVYGNETNVFVAVFENPKSRGRVAITIMTGDILKVGITKRFLRELFEIWSINPDKKSSYRYQLSSRINLWANQSTKAITGTAVAAKAGSGVR
jgi:hypothetical protein